MQGLQGKYTFQLEVKWVDGLLGSRIHTGFSFGSRALMCSVGKVVCVLETVRVKVNNRGVKKVAVVNKGRNEFVKMLYVCMFH